MGNSTYGTINSLQVGNLLGFLVSEYAHQNWIQGKDNPDGYKTDTRGIVEEELQNNSIDLPKN